MRETVIVIFDNQITNQKTDIEIPLYITANELIYGLNQGLHLQMQLDKIENCYLCTENPIALLRGNITLKDFGLRNGTVIHYQG